jgi:hypothetical protein
MEIRRHADINRRSEYNEAERYVAKLSNDPIAEDTGLISTNSSSSNIVF